MDKAYSSIQHRRRLDRQFRQAETARIARSSKKKVPLKDVELEDFNGPGILFS